VRGPEADVRPLRRRRAELPRDRRGHADLDRHRHEPAVLCPPEAAGLPERAVTVMTRKRNPDRPPTPDQLAAFAAGEPDSEEPGPPPRTGGPPSQRASGLGRGGAGRGRGGRPPGRPPRGWKPPAPGRAWGATPRRGRPPPPPGPTPGRAPRPA